MNNLVIYTDGAARGNPGQSASGYAIYENGRKIASDVFYNGIKTNNYAEYVAVIKALEWCAKNFDPGSSKIELFSDSTLVVGQLAKGYKVKSANIKPLHEKAAKLSKMFYSINFKNVPRENKGISDVDSSLNRFLDKKEKKA
ncbi:MAG: ribonuclease HI family protein [Candidatus Micrarchaeaceae archaeon]